METHGPLGNVIWGFICSFPYCWLGMLSWSEQCRVGRHETHRGNDRRMWKEGEIWGGGPRGEKLPRDDEVSISASCQHMVSFSIIGRLIGTFSIFCLDPNQDVSSGALEALYYMFTILVLQRSK